MTEERVAIVTGGSLGIGLAAVRALAGKGIKVAALARDPGRLQQAVAGLDGVAGIAADVSDEDIVGRLIPALGDMSLRDAAKLISDMLGVPKSRVYDLGIKLRKEL